MLAASVTSNFPGLASSRSWLLDSSCQALARSDEGMPFLQRIFTWGGTGGRGGHKQGYSISRLAFTWGNTGRGI